ncbi:FadR/GntR family transcriptional regulator [Microbacterium sp. 1.5R]|uniref:FadR/GntR family transcriptional regulator n=1 Tax=Microbacterium sp. 1.5R TaxID=1916917 RepID=UPI0011A0866D|nr:FCD domain-containing protein [Microbacterium sp. 1.5R]
MKRETLQSDLLERLGARIVAGAIAPGTILRAELLEQEYAVSRTVVREATKVLEAMRLVRIRRAVGISVLPRSEWNAFDPRVIRWRLASGDRARQLQALTELRIAVEPVAAFHAATNATARERTRLERLAHDLFRSGSAGDLDTFLDLDIAYHQLLLRASGNEMFAALTEVVSEVLTGRTVHHLMPQHPKAQATELHIAVSAAVAGGQSSRARSAMRSLLLEVQEVVEGIQDTDAPFRASTTDAGAERGHPSTER